MTRFSIRTLMAFVVLIAAGIVALKTATAVSAEIVVLLTLSAVGTAILGAIFTRGPKQAWWIGFTLFSAGYFALQFTSIIDPQITTFQMLKHLRLTMFPYAEDVRSNISAPVMIAQEATVQRQLAHQFRVSADVTNDPVIKRHTQNLQEIRSILTTLRPTGPEEEHFQKVGNAMLSLLVGFIGGTLAVWFYQKRE